MLTHHYLLHHLNPAGVVITLMVTGHDLVHLFIAPDNVEETTTVLTPQTAICVMEGEVRTLHSKLSNVSVCLFV